MKPHPSEHDHETLYQIISGAYEVYSTHLREAWRRRFDLPAAEQEELATLVRAHDAAIQIITSSRQHRAQNLTAHSPTMGEA